ncbi:MAG TPA: hypothetical protein VHC41_03505 [Mycobacteriales bacterium]|nr:hypothetical protein [Mycobacteriales bacterium]
MFPTEGAKVAWAIASRSARCSGPGALLFVDMGPLLCSVPTSVSSVMRRGLDQGSTTARLFSTIYSYLRAVAADVTKVTAGGHEAGDVL